MPASLPMQFYEVDKGSKAKERHVSLALLPLNHLD